MRPSYSHSVATILAVGVAVASATGIIVPLYVFPGDANSCTAWTPLISVMNANPSVPFTLIVNPASGPGAANSQPDPNSYQGCIPHLKAVSNAKVIGYVPTGEGQRSQADVEQDIATYAGWASAYRPEGVFFDQVEPSAALLSLYTTYAQDVRSSFSGATVVLNPGSGVGSTGYFSIADQVVTAENFFDDFSASQLSITSSSPASKQAVILHDGPSSPPSSLVSQLVASDGLGLLYITDDTEANGGNPYDSLPTDLSSFVSLVSADT